MRDERKEWELAHLGLLSRSWDGFKTSTQGLLLCNSCLNETSFRSLPLVGNGSILPSVGTTACCSAGYIYRIDGGTMFSYVVDNKSNDNNMYSWI